MTETISAQATTDTPSNDERGGSPERRRLLERAGKLWDQFVTKADRSLFDPGFTGWDSTQNTQVWQSVAASRVPRLMRLVKDVSPDQLDKAIEAYLRGIDELYLLRDQIRAIDTAAANTDPAGGGDGAHAGALAAELSHRSQERLSGTAPGLLASKFAGKKMAISPKVMKVGPEAGASIGVSAARAQVLSAMAGSVKKVDRIDEALVELLRERASVSLRAAGIEPSGSGTEPGAISRPAVVSAALVMVLRASGMSGIRLNEEGELLVELLGDTGDLARTASIDARLALLGEQLDRMEATGRATHNKTVHIERQGFLTNLITNFSLAERLRVVRPGADRPETEVDVADPKALTLLDNMTGQARRELTRRTNIKGRPGPGRPGDPQWP
ncbi:MAG: hypothetical protein DI630_00675 [Gordonia sp. (in: high G+C Gram-positive bacteria)]|nr:MAG: hypothetical protein DI630_00675 [Gordonia sp. (in: high G+C Gram-positive bacteria)]